MFGFRKISLEISDTLRKSELFKNSSAWSQLYKNSIGISVYVALIGRITFE